MAPIRRPDRDLGDLTVLCCSLIAHIPNVFVLNRTNWVPQELAYFSVEF